MATTKPDLTRVWANGAPPANVVDPDTTTPGKVNAGWQAEVPPFEHFNFLQKWFTQGLAHNNEQGINVWDTNTTYPINGLAKGSNGLVYKSVSEQSGNDPIIDNGDNWVKQVIAVIVRESVEAMKTDTALEADDYVQTVDYYSTHSGGGAYYLIKTLSQSVTDGDVIDGWGNHTLSNGNVAILQIQGTFHVDQFGAGDISNVADSYPPINACHVKASGKVKHVTYGGSKIYGVSQTVTFLPDNIYVGAGANIQANAGFSATSPLVDCDPLNYIEIYDFWFDANNIAQDAAYFEKLQGPNSIVRGCRFKNATRDGLSASVSITANYIGCKSLDNGRFGYNITDSNQACILSCEAIGNGSNGFTVTGGSFGFSSGVNLLACTSQENGGIGILTKTKTRTLIDGAWVEGNTDDGIVVGDDTVVTGGFSAHIKSATVLIAANGGSSNVAIRANTNARGFARDCDLYNSGGGVNFVLSKAGVDNLGFANFKTKNILNGNDRTEIFTQYINETPFGVFLQREKDAGTGATYKASKFLDVSGTVSWTKILTAKSKSSIEAVFRGADGNGTPNGEFILKTFSTASVSARQSFGDIGPGLTNDTSTSVGAHWFPVGLSGGAPSIRWNGNDLEIKAALSTSNQMYVDIEINAQDGDNIVEWLL